MRAQLSLVLQGVISQQLIPRRDGRGPLLAAEVMIPNAAIRNLIREEKVHQIYSQMQVGQTKFGMQTMSQSLVALVQQNLITRRRGARARDRARGAHARCSASAARRRRAGAAARAPRR